MISAHLRQDVVIKALCLLVLALYELPYGADWIYFRTFFIGPLLAVAAGYALGFYLNKNQSEAEREAQLFPPGFLSRILKPLSLVTVAGTLLVMMHNIHVGTYARTEWWPVVVGMLMGRSIGELVQISKSGSWHQAHAA